MFNISLSSVLEKSMLVERARPLTSKMFQSLNLTRYFYKQALITLVEIGKTRFWDLDFFSFYKLFQVIHTLVSSL